MKTTVIGSYPKPTYLKIPNWFEPNTVHATEESNKFIKNSNKEELERLIYKATEEIILEQKQFKIDTITDGEVRRENYIYSFCRSLHGIDFNYMTPNVMRNGAYTVDCPTIISKLNFKEGLFQSDEWFESNKIAKKHGQTLKFTIPGPMTICDSISNNYYKSDKELCEDLAKLIRREFIHLKDLGCKNIQIDEPLFARKTDMALDWGIDLLDSIINDINDIYFTVHICCGYPSYLDQIDYIKAPIESYNILSEKLDQSNVNAISIEDSHCHLDLTFLEKIKKKDIIFGVIAIAKSEIETVECIQNRIKLALKYITKDRLIISPDCGLGYLSKEMIFKKLINMMKAVESFTYV